MCCYMHILSQQSLYLKELQRSIVKKKNEKQNLQITMKNATVEAASYCQTWYTIAKVKNGWS